MPARGLRIDIGGGRAAAPDHVNLDPIHGRGTWRRRIQDGIPAADGNVEAVRCSHLMEHIPAGPERIAVFNEVWRVLRAGGTFEVLVPLFPSYGAVADPTHVSYWCEQCVAPETPVLCADLAWRPAGSLAVGDGLLAFDEEPQRRPGPKGRVHASRRFTTAVVRRNALEVQPCIELRTAEADPVVASAGHPWLVLRDDRFGWVRTEDLHLGDRIGSIGRPWTADDTRDGGWLAGMFDGEGCLSATRRPKGDVYTLSVAQRESSTLERLKIVLAAKGFTFAARRSVAPKQRVPGWGLWLIGGRREMWRFLGSIRPDRFMERGTAQLYEGCHVKNGSTVTTATVMGLVDLGPRPVAGLQTSTGTFIAGGLLAHNSFWYFDGRMAANADYGIRPWEFVEWTTREWDWGTEGRWVGRKPCA